MKPDHGQLLYEGKAKRVFSSGSNERVLVEFKDDATAFNAQKRAKLEGKGQINCQISASIFEVLEREGVPTHYLGLESDNWMVAQYVDVIPLEVVLRNIATGSLCRETPIPFGTELSPALLDLYYKDDALSDPLLSEARLEKLGLLSKQKLLEVETLSRKVNQVLTSFFANLDLLLVDFKLEIGLNQHNQLVLADEVSPDTCRLWDQRISDPEERILDKDRFRKDLGGVVEGYGEILKRIQGVCPKPRNYK